MILYREPKQNKEKGKKGREGGTGKVPRQQNYKNTTVAGKFTMINFF